MKKHIQSFHPREYEDYLQRRNVVAQRECDIQNIIEPVLTNKQRSLLDYFEKKTAVVSFDRATIVNGIVKLICHGCRPFSMLEEHGFLQLFNPIFDAMGFRVTPENIAYFINIQYEMIKSRLGELICNRLISVKVDCASAMDRSFLGINIQFLHNESIVVFTLSAVELKERHTGENLKRYILQELEKYGVFPSQIYTITCDTGSTLQKACELINNELYQIDVDGHDSFDDHDYEEQIQNVTIDIFDDVFTESLKKDFIIGEKNLFLFGNIFILSYF